MYICIKKIDITAILAALPVIHFQDSGGTNGWLATPLPDWTRPFVAGLGFHGIVTDIFCRKLPAGQGIPPHIDLPVSRSTRLIERRFHVPLVTHPQVFMRWPEANITVHLAAGYLYEIRQDCLHEVVQHAPIDRIHLQINVTYPTQGADPCFY